ncbi:MAG: TetR-like C-terminal domain-containing protein [Actinomycetota bacterium]
MIYGSPVPGYAAPEDTIAPASRVTLLLLQLLADLDAADAPLAESAPALAPELDAQLTALVEGAEQRVSPERMSTGIGVWTELYGMINFELFGQFQNVFDDADALFAARVAAMGARMGIS